MHKLYKTEQNKHLELSETLTNSRSLLNCCIVELVAGLMLLREYNSSTCIFEQKVSQTNTTLYNYKQITVALTSSRLRISSASSLISLKASSRIAVSSTQGFLISGASSNGSEGRFPRSDSFLGGSSCGSWS